MFGPIKNRLVGSLWILLDKLLQTRVQGSNTDRRWHVDLRAGTEAGEHRGERRNHSAGRGGKALAALWPWLQQTFVM
jgi:hypothetical protein